MPRYVVQRTFPAGLKARTATDGADPCCSVVERNAEKFALLQRRDTEAINAAGAEELARLGMAVVTPDTASFRLALGPFYARWRERAGPEAWRLLESYAGAIGGQA